MHAGASCYEVILKRSGFQAAAANEYSKNKKEESRSEQARKQAELNCTILLHINAKGVSRGECCEKRAVRGGA